MKKILKTIILLPAYPLIFLSGARSANDDIFSWQHDSCYERGVELLRWRLR